MVHINPGGDSHRPEVSPRGTENRTGIDALATHPAVDGPGKRELLEEALYWDELNDRTAPWQDDTDEEDVPVL